MSVLYVPTSIHYVLFFTFHLSQLSKEFVQSDSHNCGFFVLLNIGLLIATASQCNHETFLKREFEEKYKSTLVSQEVADEIIPLMREWLYSIVCNCSVQDKYLKLPDINTNKYHLEILAKKSIPNHTEFRPVTTPVSHFSYSSITTKFELIKIDNFPFFSNIKIPSIALNTLLFFHEFDDDMQTLMQPLINESPVNEDSVTYKEEDSCEIYHCIVYNKTNTKIKIDSDDSDNDDDDSDDDDDDDVIERQLYNITDDATNNVKETKETHSIPTAHRISDNLFRNSIFVEFLKEVSKLDLLIKDHMLRLEKIFRKYQNSSFFFDIGMSRTLPYRPFFENNTLNENQIADSPFTLYKKFSQHVRTKTTCTLRLGTILGTCNLLKHYRNIGKMDNILNVSQSKKVSCIVSNFDDDNVDFSTGRSWSTQLRDLRTHSCHDKYQRKALSTRKPTVETTMTSSTIQIDNFPFSVNVEVQNINISFILLFHEMSNDQRSIIQPLFNHHNINHRSPQFQSFFEDIKKGTFRDKSIFHFIAYLVHPITINHTTTTIREHRLMYPIDGDIATPKRLHVSESLSTFCVADSISDEYFQGHLVPFILACSCLDLFKKEDMVKLDDKLSITNSSIVWEYDRFFVDGKLSKMQEQLPTQQLYQEFGKHLRKHSVIRIGTLEGIHRLFCIYYLVRHLKYDVSELQNEYIRGTHICFITNMKRYNTEEDFNTQIEDIQKHSMSYVKKKSNIVGSSSIDTIFNLCSKFHDTQNDIIYPLVQSKTNISRVHYFNNIAYPLIGKFRDFLYHEAKQNIVNPTHFFSQMESVSIHPVIRECWLSCPMVEDRDKVFWDFLKFDPITSMNEKRASSVNIKTNKFYFYGRTNISMEQEAFIKFFGIVRNKKPKMDQSYVIHSMRNFLISINISSFSYYSLMDKISEIQQVGGVSFDISQNNLDDRKTSFKTHLRFMDSILISK